MNPLQEYKEFRQQSKHKPSLRLQLILLVSAELLVCFLLALGLYYLLENLIPINGKLLLFLLVLLSLAIGVLVISFVSKFFFDPIKKLREGMGQVAAGDFNVQLESQSASNEIMELYSGFNLMVSELKATEILQTDFVSNVSHEFKTPINAIEGYSLLLQSSDNLTEEQQKYLDKIVYNTQRLSTLVGSILLLSKIENQSIPSKSSRYRLDEQIRQSIVALEPMWEKRKTEFDVELDCVEYNGNEALMHHVWDNLINNAIKFGPDRGLVVIRLKHEKHRATFTIDNQSDKLSDEVQRHLFDKFYQADSSHKADGYGLGLTLVKRILDFSGDEIFAENTDQGCRFTVVLNL